MQRHLFAYNNEDNTYGFDYLDLKIDLGVDLEAGIGVNCLSAGIYGSAELGFSIDIWKTFEMRTVELSGEVGLYVKLLFYSEKFPIVSGSTTIYDRDAKIKKPKHIPSLLQRHMMPTNTT